MGTNQMDRSQGETWDDERLLEWILNQETARGLDESGPTDPAALARMGQLSEFLSDCRSALGDERMLEADRAQAREQDAALTARVLARTTREDLSWRGDLTLVAGYVRERLSRSVLLRFAAASLLLHVAALPVLAYYAFLAPAPTPIEIGTIPYLEQYPAEPFPEDRAEPESQPESRPELDLDLDEEPAVREQAGGAGGAGDKRK